MPPKAEPPAKKVLLGRPGNSVKAGIVGLPNVGKSSLFNLLCNQSVAAENYPFCTVRDNEPTPPLLLPPHGREGGREGEGRGKGRKEGKSEVMHIANTSLVYARAAPSQFLFCRSIPT